MLQRLQKRQQRSTLTRDRLEFSTTANDRVCRRAKNEKKCRRNTKKRTVATLGRERRKCFLFWRWSRIAIATNIEYWGFDSDPFQILHPERKSTASASGTSTTTDAARELSHGSSLWSMSGEGDWGQQGSVQTFQISQFWNCEDSFRGFETLKCISNTSKWALKLSETLSTTGWKSLKIQWTFRFLKRVVQCMDRNHSWIDKTIRISYRYCEFLSLGSV